MKASKAFFKSSILPPKTLSNRNESCIITVEIEHFIYLVRHWPGEHKLPIELKQSTSSSRIVNRIFCCIWRIFALIFCTLAPVSLRAAAFILDEHATVCLQRAKLYGFIVNTSLLIIL